MQTEFKYFYLDFMPKQILFWIRESFNREISSKNRQTWKFLSKISYSGKPFSKKSVFRQRKL